MSPATPECLEGTHLQRLIGTQLDQKPIINIQAVQGPALCNKCNDSNFSQCCS